MFAGMAKKPTAAATARRVLTAREFAAEMGVHYRTALRWIVAGLVPGATLRSSPFGDYWEIPATALSMERPRTGPKPSKRKEATA
jgi:hypothetical protein